MAERLAAAEIAGSMYDPTMIAALLRQCRFRFSSEGELRTGIAEVLDRHRIPYSREHVLSAADHRIDFLLAGGVGLDVTIAGSVSDLLRQCARYAEQPEIAALVVVTGDRRLAGAVPMMGLRGAPMVAVNVRSGVL